MFGAGHANDFDQSFSVYVIHSAGYGNDDTGLAEIGNAYCFTNEILEHQFCDVKICNLSVMNR